MRPFENRKFLFDIPCQLVHPPKEGRLGYSLGQYLEPNDTKQTRQDKISLAENYKAKRLLELANEKLGLPSKEKMEKDFIAYFKDEMNRINVSQYSRY